MAVSLSPKVIGHNSAPFVKIDNHFSDVNTYIRSRYCAWAISRLASLFSMDICPLLANVSVLC